MNRSFSPLMRVRSLAAVAAAAAIGCGDSSAHIQTTTIILPAAAGGEAFEPSIAIDPGNANRLLVGAMYGVPFARGATGIWVWRSSDGGRSWTHAPLEPPRMPGGLAPTFAADVITAFAQDGAPLLASKADAPPLGGTFLSRFGVDTSSVASVPVYRNFVDSAAGYRVLHDKPWLVVDHNERSSHLGSIYLSVGAVKAGLGPAGVNVNWTLLGSQQLLSYSRDGGRTFSSPIIIADSSAFGGYLAVGPTGSVEVVYVRIKNRDGAADAVIHRRSSDGGVTFEPPVTVVAMRGDTLLELPVVAARPNGDLMACWSEGVRSDERSNRVRCAVRTSSAWSASYDIASALPPDVVPAWPALVGTERGWYLMLYLVGAAGTEVALFRADALGEFAKIATLSVMDGLGADRFCVASATPCRRTRKDAFVIGDYVALAANRGRLAAAYVFPRTSSSTAGSAAIYVTTLAEPPR